MILVKDIKTLKKHLFNYKDAGKTIGFVPTMGALHDGHISLVQKAIGENDVLVCSIFVNPTQFNNAADFQKYPITIEADIDKLEKAGCGILFLPSVEEMYPSGEKHLHYELGSLETILEGKYRPGHFQGVCMIVDKLLSAVTPNVMYLGRKDYQQCMVIGKMMQLRQYNIRLSICDTIREKDGLAMSSRNMRLNEAERKQALRIIESLTRIKDNIKKGNIGVLKKEATLFLENNGYKVDYTEIADAETLELQHEWDGEKKLVALVAAYLNEVRLIDNIILNS
jgi:pantoate--beta-alanine ligase